MALPGLKIKSNRWGIFQFVSISKDDWTLEFNKPFTNFAKLTNITQRQNTGGYLEIGFAQAGEWYGIDGKIEEPVKN